MITEKQKEARKKSIGSSDAAAVLGLDSYRNAYDLWLEKTGRVEGFSGNKATERGDYLEDGILRWASDRIGQKVVKPSNAFTKGILRAHVDGQIDKYGRGNPIVEAKNMVMPGEWGEEMTDQVPNNVFIQVQHQMVCAEAPYAYVARLSGGSGMAFSIYRVEANQEIQDAIVEESEAFWAKYVEADEPPPYTHASESMVKYMAGLARGNTETAIDDQLLADYIQWQTRAKDAESELRLCKARILEAMGEHGKGVGRDYMVKMVQVKPTKRLDTKAFKADCPDQYEDYLIDKDGYAYPKVSRIKKETA